MIPDSVYTLVNPVDKQLAFRLRMFEDDSAFNRIQRNSFSSIIWLREGSGKIKIDFNEYQFNKESIFFLSPFQPHIIECSEQIKGIIIDFHTDFFCLLKHQKEVAFCGLIFNNIYDPPLIMLSAADAELFKVLTDQIKEEVKKTEFAQHELIVSILKIFMIHAARLKMEQQPPAESYLTPHDSPFILQNLKDAIDTHFREKHTASEYADVLNISPKSLAKITKTYFKKTLTNLISERIVIEAKRDLYMTSKPVKEIAFSLGFEDEYHFSRYFKNYTAVSPQICRNSLKTPLLT
jgi:AraC family transcriptional regulator, transcriptional activator of pobA